MAEGSSKDTEILTIAEAAIYLRIGRSTLYRLVEKQQVPAVRIGKSVRVRLSILQAFLDAQDGGCPDV